MGNRMNGRFNPLVRRSLLEAAQELIEDPPQGLASVEDDGTIHLGAFSLTPKGLQISGSVTEDEWLKVGGAIRKLQSSVQFLIGDWLAYGEREWGRTYEEAAGLFGYEIDSLRTFVWVCKAVKVSIRMDKLEFGHHALVASSDPESQRYWLRMAYTEGWSVARLRAEMRGPVQQRPVSQKAVYRRFSKKLMPQLAKTFEQMTVAQLEEALNTIEDALRKAYEQKQQQNEDESAG